MFYDCSRLMHFFSEENSEYAVGVRQSARIAFESDVAMTKLRRNSGRLVQDRNIDGTFGIIILWILFNIFFRL